MKRRRGTVALSLLAGSTVLILAVPGFAEEKSGTVIIGEKGIILHPGTKLSKPDQIALNEVLKKYDKSLYKIDTYRNGEKKRSQGQLSDVCLDQSVVAEVAATKGNSNKTLQIILSPTNPLRNTAGSTVNPQGSPSGSSVNPQSNPSGSSVNPQRSPGSPTNPLSTPGSPTNPLTSPGSPTNPLTTPGASTNPLNPCSPDEKAAKELIERLKPILEKYSKK